MEGRKEGWKEEQREGRTGGRRGRGKEGWKEGGLEGRQEGGRIQEGVAVGDAGGWWHQWGLQQQRPRGLMDKASDFGSED